MRSTRPKISDLRRMLQRGLIDEGEMVSFIVLDALDESDEDDREKLFDLIQDISLLGGLDIHFFVTSRTNTRDAEKVLNTLPNCSNVSLGGEHLDLDILTQIQERLHNNRILQEFSAQDARISKRPSCKRLIASSWRFANASHLMLYERL